MICSASTPAWSRQAADRDVATELPGSARWQHRIHPLSAYESIGTRSRSVYGGDEPPRSAARRRRREQRSPTGASIRAASPARATGARTPPSSRRESRIHAGRRRPPASPARRSPNPSGSGRSLGAWSDFLRPDGAQGLLADVGSVLHAVEPDLAHRRVGTRDRRLVGRALPDQVHTRPPAVVIPCRPPRFRREDRTWSAAARSRPSIGTRSRSTPVPA